MITKIEIPDFSVIKKIEIKDEETGIKTLNYKCRHCGSVLLSANMDMLSFIIKYEKYIRRKNEEKDKVKDEDLVGIDTQLNEDEFDEDYEQERKEKQR